jgi:hypothetical protein
VCSANTEARACVDVDAGACVDVVAAPCIVVSVEICAGAVAGTRTRISAILFGCTSARNNSMTLVPLRTIYSWSISFRFSSNATWRYSSCRNTACLACLQMVEDISRVEDVVTVYGLLLVCIVTEVS